MQHSATRCNTLQHTATHCNTLQHTATHCNPLQHTATQSNTAQYAATHCSTLQHTATHYNAPYSFRHASLFVRGAVFWRCSVLQCVACASVCMNIHIQIHTFKRIHAHIYGMYISIHTYCETLWTLQHVLQHTATHCNTLQHTATHCNTLQHTATHCNTPQHAHIYGMYISIHMYSCMLWTLQHVLQHTAIHCNTLQHTATHCNTLQHTATVTHCNTL